MRFTVHFPSISLSMDVLYKILTQLIKFERVRRKFLNFINRTNTVFFHENNSTTYYLILRPFMRPPALYYFSFTVLKLFYGHFEIMPHFIRPRSQLFSVLLTPDSRFSDVFTESFNVLHIIGRLFRICVCQFIDRSRGRSKVIFLGGSVLNFVLIIFL